jgi:nickel-dependent lactate racemase
MLINLKYGTNEESVNIPDKNLIGVATPKQVPSVLDYRKEIEKTLLSPVEKKPLHILAQGRKKVCIIISDHTRPTPSKVLIPYIWKELAKANLDRDQVCILLATGLHDAPSREIIINMLGEEIVNRFRVEVHNPYDRDNLVDLGKTSHDTPVLINRLAAESDLLISVSCVEPHRLYGWNGGAKNILPGISAEETISVHHGRFGRRPGGLDMIDGNYFRADAEEAAAMANLEFILNVAINHQKEIIGVFTGDPIAAHRKAVEFGRSFVICPFEEMADLLICSLGGSPRDLDFWQAEGKGMAATSHLLKEGGTMILAASCETGVGVERFADLLRKDAEEMDHIAASGVVTPLMIKALSVPIFLEKKSLIMVSEGLSKKDFPKLPVEFAPDIQIALDNCMAEYKDRDIRIIVVPQAPQVVLKLQ